MKELREGRGGTSRALFKNLREKHKKGVGFVKIDSLAGWSKRKTMILSASGKKRPSGRDYKSDLDQASWDRAKEKEGGFSIRNEEFASEVLGGRIPKYPARENRGSSLGCLEKR